ncbi:hypothetical protein WG906_04310 [Pedobacter sp. P351]|uniref:hypothetical protein n=1 Tax=Pedobacter superstes TaxID=3133441 RepID=UPI0030A1E5EA
MLLNRANRVLGIIEISIGGTSSTVADPKIIIGWVRLVMLHWRVSLGAWLCNICYH